MTTFLFLIFPSALILVFGVGLGYAAAVLTGLANASRAPRDQKRSEEKGLSLLRSWLSPEQAELWDSHRQFYVVGSDTGTRYRIRYGTAMNIEELDSGGKAIAQWCFAPQGRLVVGDVLLAQKIALETMERKALAAANRQGSPAAWCHFDNMRANDIHSLAAPVPPMPSRGRSPRRGIFLVVQERAQRAAIVRPRSRGSLPRPRPDVGVGT